jgi:succinylglutamate desuccinylase
MHRMNAHPQPQACPSAFAAGREIGRYGSAEAGPTLVATGGLHGNEPGGVVALGRVFRELAERKPAMKGQLLGLVGNSCALARSTRFVDEDMNRVWTKAGVEALRRQDPSQDHSEQREQRELLAILDPLLAAAAANPRRRAMLLDLHSTSGGGPPFIVMGDTLQNRELAFALKAPVLLGLEENIEGTLIEYFAAGGNVAVVLEGGQNEDPRTADNHESALWIALVACGLLDAAQVPDLARHTARLAAAASGVPGVIEVVHRHDIAPENETNFRMLPGLKGFMQIEKGRLLAHDGPHAQAQVTAPFSGVLLMPRYQPKGLDGFFMGKTIEPFWLRVSAVLRKLRMERVISLLPGVHENHHGPNTLAVDPKIARFFTLEFFHLLGYRKHVEHEQRLVFSRRNDRL